MSDPDKTLRLNTGDDDPAWWEGFIISWDTDGLLIEARYDSGCAGMQVKLDADEVRQLLSLIPDDLT